MTASPGVRVGLALALLCLVLLFPAAYALDRLGDLRAIAGELEGSRMSAGQAVKRAQIELRELDRFSRGFIVSGGVESRGAMREAIDRAGRAAEDLESTGYAESGQAFGARIEEIRSASLEIESLVDRGLADEAVAAFSRFRGLLEDAEEPLQTVAVAIDRESAAAVVRAGGITRQVQRTVWITAVGGILLAILLGLWIGRGFPARRAALPALESRPPVAIPQRPEVPEPAELSLPAPGSGPLPGSSRDRLRTRLDLLGIYAANLANGQGNDRDPGSDAFLRDASEQVGELVEEVDQELGRIDEGGTRDRDSVDVAELLAAAAGPFDPLARLKGIHFEVDLSSDAPATIHADREGLRSDVLINLLTNAFRSTPRGGRVTLRGRDDPEGLRIEIEDTGEGIVAEQVPQVFERPTLDAARRAVEAEDGGIGVVSDPGIGTTVWFTIPSGPHA